MNKTQKVTLQSYYLLYTVITNSWKNSNDNEIPELIGQ